MNSGGPLVILATIGTMMMAAFVAVSVLMSNGNELGNMLYYVMIAGGVFGAIAPRLSLSLLIVELTFLDLIKRMLVFAGSVAQPDLFWVLGVAPITMAGIFTGTLLRVLMDDHLRRPGDLMRLTVVALLNVLLFGVSIATGKGIGGTLREMANSSLYSTLIFVIPVLLRDTTDMIRMMRLLLVVFIPVALYGVYQGVFGFQEFEIEYLKRGLSIEIKQLMTDRVRPFSTLNSPTALGSVCGMLTAFCWFMAGRQSGSGRTILPPALAFLCGLCYFAGLVSSTSRSEFLMLPAIGVAIWAFPSAKRTLLVYLISFVCFTTLVVASPMLLENLDAWNNLVFNITGSSAYLANMMTIGTYFDRLNGFANVLLNPAAWTLLGMNQERIDHEFPTHDPISHVLARFGIIGLVLAAVLISISLRALHRQILSIHSLYGRKLCSALLGVAFGVAVTSVLSGSRLMIFPVNALLWIFLASVAVIASHDQRHWAAAQDRTEEPSDHELRHNLASSHLGQPSPAIQIH
jgi:hypothetical protein